MNFDVYTDGSALGNPGPGGWAYVVYERKHRNSDGAPIGAKIYEESGHHPQTTNNRMEWFAVVKAMEFFAAYEGEWEYDIFIHADSQYVVNICAGIWNVKANRDIWKMWLDQANRLLALGRYVQYLWVPGHDGIKGNERADYLANWSAHNQDKLYPRS